MGEEKPELIKDEIAQAEVCLLRTLNIMRHMGLSLDASEVIETIEELSLLLDILEAHKKYLIFKIKQK